MTGLPPLPPALAKWPAIARWHARKGHVITASHADLKAVEAAMSESGYGQPLTVALVRAARDETFAAVVNQAFARAFDRGWIDSPATVPDAIAAMPGGGRQALKALLHTSPANLQEARALASYVIGLIETKTVDITRGQLITALRTIAAPTAPERAADIEALGRELDRLEIEHDAAKRERRI